LECGGSTPLTFFFGVRRLDAAYFLFWSAAARRRFLSFSESEHGSESKKKESGVEPPHSKKALDFYRFAPRQ